MRRLALVAAALVLVAPGSAAAGAPTTLLRGSHVGRLDGTRAFVGVSLDRGVLRAYVCDGTPRRAATIARWFRARWDGRHPMTLTAGGLGLRLAPLLPGGRVRGSVVAFSGPHAFELRRATGRAGLYEGFGEGRKLHAGWVVLGDGSRRGAMVPTRPPKCRYVLVAGPGGSQQQVLVC